MTDSHLDNIARRHERDRWRDLGFLVVALLVVAFGIALTTSKAIATTTVRTWSVIVVDPETQRELR